VLTLAPLRRLLALGSAGSLPLGGFALGFGLPWLVGRLGGGEVIVRQGRDCTLPLPTSEPRV